MRAGLEEAAVAVIESVLAAIDSVPEDLRVELTMSRWRAERRLAAYAARD